MSTNSFETKEGQLPVIYALIWKANETGESADQAFQERIPRLMDWLKGLKEKGHLVACGGGSFEEEAGGLTLIRAHSPEEALSLSGGSPMNEIGKTEMMLWDVFHAELDHPNKWT